MLVGKRENLVRGFAWFNGLPWTIVFRSGIFSKIQRIKNANEKTSDFDNHSYCGDVKKKRPGRAKKKKKTPVDFFFHRIVYTFRTGWANNVNSEQHFRISNDGICLCLHKIHANLCAHKARQFGWFLFYENICTYHESSQWKFIRAVDFLSWPQWRTLWRRIHLRTARYYWLFDDMNGIVRQIMLQRNAFCVCVYICAAVVHGTAISQAKIHKRYGWVLFVAFLGANRKIIFLPIYHLSSEKCGVVNASQWQHILHAIFSLPHK